MRIYQTVVSTLIAGAMLLGSIGCRSDGSPQGGSLDVQESIRVVVGSDTSNSVQQFYEDRAHRPAWVAEGQAPARLRQAVDALCGAASHGLNAADYLSPEFAQKVELAYGGETESDSIRALRLAELDVAVSKRLMELSDDLITGRVNPKAFGGTWKTPVHEIDPVEVVTAAASQADPSAITRRATRAHDQYGALANALGKYRNVQRSGGFPTIEAGEPLSPGDSSMRVQDVRRRLVASGDLDSTALADSSLVYSDQLTESVRSFQERHGLTVDGVVGESVISAMNVPVQDRIRQIELNLERWRWIPENLGGRYLYVNIPAFRLRAFENGDEVLESKVVVGEEYNGRSTPVFSDTMEYVVFNPYWNIPQGIAKNEILPNAQSNPSYLSANNYEIVSGWGQGADVVSATQRNMDLVESGQYRLRQTPGPQNALGRIKFMFPNQFDIYLHDTPADHLFDRVDRAYSHGCIRVEKEIALGEYAFTGWSQSQIEEAIASRERSTEYLDDPVPVYILYWTSFVDDTGRIHFRDDIYGHDEALRTALAEQAPNDAAVSCQSLLSTLDSSLS